MTRRLPKGVSLRHYLLDLERGFVEQALIDNHWRFAGAARTLRMGRTTLIEKARKHGLLPFNCEKCKRKHPVDCCEDTPV